MGDMEQGSEHLNCTADSSTLQAGRDGVERVVIDDSTALKLGRSRSGKGASSCSYSGQDSGEAHLEDADLR
jgi:hypothetical protein